MRIIIWENSPGFCVIFRNKIYDFCPATGFYHFKYIWWKNLFNLFKRQPLYTGPIDKESK